MFHANAAPNFNPETGIRYGVIALNSLDPDTSAWLWDDATNLSEEEAYADAKRELEEEWDDHMEQAQIAASETDPSMSDQEKEKFIEKWFESKQIDEDRETFVERKLENVHIEIEEPTLEGECEGVKYQISHLGGAPLLWILQGPQGFAAELCSPCVPNAANLDGGFSQEYSDEFTYPCYITPAGWLAKE